MIHRRVHILWLICLLLVACTKESKYTTAIISATFENAEKISRVPITTNADSINASKYAIKLSFAAVITGDNGGTDVKGETQYSLTNRVISTAVYSPTDFNSTHPAGTSLADCFNLLSDTLTVQLNAFTGYNINASFKFADKRSNQDTFRYAAFLILSSTQYVAGPRDFVISMTLADSTHFSDTLHVYLK
ncbi:hypothetical protein CJD36_004905 [Flavipsychrobacter stenotrophus]|uniref:Lipoprotein n=1 Tax=Flavipsychrobacter stenotrophus TaxID=2077091 RepID=A0A2S7T2V0_9BACT|nr:hypothetical protein [Flavipsychrobacter stenotrophus]PQJ13086.1 hypothetical protein CJD36_004905 [Flavipsychrobacter stenotrophus]